ncbi:MAG: hypothetical protein IPN80_05020 [Flavobacterium sp.]|nr:hypothetical protein [Flavobacterium sp.]
MKLVVGFLLVLFVTYIATPTFVILIENGADISLDYDLSEEENQKENKEIKSDFTLKTHLEHITFNTVLRKAIILENVLKHNTISEEIIIPPPKLI